MSSASHWTGEIHWDDLQLAAPGAYDGLRAYDQSKLAVLMLTLALARRLEGSGVTRGRSRPGRRGHHDAGERVARTSRASPSRTAP